MRYLRLYLHFLQFAMAKFSAFRFDFFSRIFMDLLFYSANMGIFQVIFLHAEEVGGWNKSQVMFFMSIYFTVDALSMIATAGSMWNFPKEINKGAFDYYLLRPVSTIFFCCFREINLASGVNLLMALGLLVWSYQGLMLPFDLTVGIKIFIAVLAGFYFHWILHLMVLLPVFWTHSVNGLRSIFFILLVLAERPDGIFRGVIHKILISLFPLALVASYPARLIFEEHPQKYFLHLVVVAAVFAVAARFFWSRGLRAYSSASS